MASRRGRVCGELLARWVTLGPARRMGGRTVLEGGLLLRATAEHARVAGWDGNGDVEIRLREGVRTKRFKYRKLQKKP